MASWFKNGRPSLFEAFNKICDQIDQDIRADLLDDKSTKQTPNYQTTLDELKSRNDDLEKENVSLRKEVETLRRIASTPADGLALQHLPPGSSIADDVLEPLDNEYVPILKYVNLAQRFKALNDNFRKARATLERRKAERDAWKKRYETLHESVQEDESEHGIQASSRASAALAALQPIASSVNNSFSSNADVSEEALIRPKQAEPELPTNVPDCDSPSANAKSHIIDSMDSTQGESETNDLPTHPASTLTPSDPTIKKELSSDSPVMISERIVKKRKIEHDTISSSATRIKQESRDASPEAVYSRIAASQESIDLGHVTCMMTPRKPRETNFPSVLPAINEKSLSILTSQAQAANPMAKFVRRDMPMPASARASVMSSALTPISVNRRISRSEVENSARKRSLESGIADIAEDGLRFSTGTGQEYTPIRNPNKQKSKNRVEQLLHQCGADDEPELTQSGRHRKHGVTAEISIPERRELPFEKNARQSKPRLTVALSAQPGPQPGSRSPQRPPERHAKSSGGRLRDKPVRELLLEDFRINRAANEGHDFAFLDVVRDRDDRACLPGCTEMHCCGKQFRALAMSQRADPPLTPAQRLEEQRLLENFLGDESYRLATMEVEERIETWIQAKTQELANKYGKHRHRFSRMQSPPGFWNADFPSTQELQSNREEATERETRAIQERYREAMRPGGRWAFKDE